LGIVEQKSWRNSVEKERNILRWGVLTVNRSSTYVSAFI
jgi:hypothetical protein